MHIAQFWNIIALPGIMPTRSKKSFTSAFPLFNISLPKLAFTVIFSALLTISLFVVENKNQLASTPLAAAVMAKPITITFKITPPNGQIVERTVNGFEHDTVATVLKNNFPEVTMNPTWEYSVNGVQASISPDRFALKGGDVVECKFSTN